MDERGDGLRGIRGERLFFSVYFKDLQDPRQQGKVTYPLDEILLLCLLAVLAGAETFTDIALFGEQEARPACAASARFATARRRTITWAISWPCSTPSSSSAASSPGSQR